MSLTPNLDFLLLSMTDAVVFGVLIGALAVITLLTYAMRRSLPLRLAEGALTGLPTGLIVGIVSGFVFEFIQSLLGIVRFTLAGGFSVGVTLGGVLGWLGMLALTTRQGTPWSLAIGAIIGLIAGLVAFRLAFGAHAGFGPELDSGAGPEVGILLGTVGLLVGAVVAQMIDARNSRTFRWSRIGLTALGGAVAGLIFGLIITVIGWQTVAAAFMLPELAPNYAMPGGALAGVLYGLGLFVLIGASLGATAGTVADGGLVGSLGLPFSVGIGGLIGLTLGLSHSDVGGPFAFGRHQSFDPTGTRWGLLIGLAAGLAVGALCWLALRWSERRPRTHAVVVAVLLLALSVALISTPLWFHPLFGVDIK